MLAQRFKGNLRSVLKVPLKMAMTFLVFFLTCSVTGMIWASWASCTFLVLFIMADRVNLKKDLELHTIGIEIPLAAFLIVVLFGLRSSPEGSLYSIAQGVGSVGLLFVFTYSLQVLRNLNNLLGGLVVFGFFVAGYAISQHILGMDFIHPDLSLEEIPWGQNLIKPSQGFFSNHIVFGQSFMMITCIPWAAILLSRRSPWWQNLLYVVSFLVILLSVVFSFGRGAWLALLVALPLMAFFANRKFFLTLLAVIFVCGGIFFNLSSSFRQTSQGIFSESPSVNEDRKKLWHINLEMFRDHPWVGVGYEQNERLSQSYYDKLEIKNGPIGNARSNYIQLLATTGLLGFAGYVLIIIIFLLMTARLFSIIPETHFWHRVFALGALGAQITFHVGGLTHWSFGEREVQLQFIFWLSLVGYMSQRYFLHIVSDDRSL